MLRSYITGLFRTSTSLALLVGTVLVGCAPTADDDELSDESSAVSQQGFVVDFNYSYNEMLAFDVETFCAEKAPHLLPYAEQISHVAGERRISARALIALMEQQSRAVSNPEFSVSSPLADLSDEIGFGEQLQDVSAGIKSVGDGAALRVNVNAPNSSILKMISAQELREIGEVYKKLFPGVVAEKSAVSNAASPPILMQFPFPVNESWYFGGAHADDGSGSVFSSMDFSFKWENWGDTINSYVVASAGGTVKKHSSCYVEVIHNSTWSTGYYHMGVLSVQNGQTVKANDKIGKYAKLKKQALCDGGSSTGPHVHWSLYKSGAERSLSGVVLSKWKIHPGTSNYDEDCSRMYLIRNGTKKCTGQTVLNKGM